MTTSPLRQRMHEFMHVRNYSERTQKTYLDAVAKFAAFFHTAPDKLGPPEILTYQLHLRDNRHASFSFFNQVMSDLRLFYGGVLEREEMIERIPFMHRERHLPVVLSPEEILRLIDAAETLRDRVLITVTYSAGLRLGEVCRLSVGDIDSSRRPRSACLQPFPPPSPSDTKPMASRLRPTELFSASCSVSKRDLGVETVTEETRSVRLPMR